MPQNRRAEPIAEARGSGALRAAHDEADAAGEIAVHFDRKLSDRFRLRLLVDPAIGIGARVGLRKNVREIARDIGVVCDRYERLRRRCRTTDASGRRGLQ